MTRHINDAGLRLIIDSEGFEPVPKPCPAGKPTVGYGHVVRPGEVFDNPLSTAQALGILERDLGIAAAAVERWVRVTLSDNQFAALVSFVFNLGGQALVDSTLLRKLNAGDYAGTASEFTRWDKARVLDPKTGTKNIVTLPGLTTRRAKEKALFLST